MAFTVEDFPSLLRVLDQHPEWREQLRRHVLTDELLQLPAIVRELADQMKDLARAQQSTEQRLGQMAAALESLSGRVGKIDGDMLEFRYWRRAPSYFSPLLRGLRVVDHSRLAIQLDSAVDDGRLTAAEREAILASDLILSGQRRDDRSDAYAVVEVSVGIGLEDVTRAVERARSLSKLGRPALPVVAGEWINAEATAAATSYDVWQVLNGRTASPGAA